MATPHVRKLEPYVLLTKEQFRERFFARFYDPAFDAVRAELDKVCDVAWDGYVNYRKAPRTRAAGPGYADPTYELSLQWLEAKQHIDDAKARFEDPSNPSRILVVNGSTRSEHS